MGDDLLHHKGTSMTHPMIERVAWVICEGQGLKWEDQGSPLTSGSGADDRAAFLKEAEEAISAMRNPTDDMVMAAQRRNDSDEESLCHGIWRAMIDAILEGGRK